MKRYDTKIEFKPIESDFEPIEGYEGTWLEALAPFMFSAVFIFCLIITR